MGLLLPQSGNKWALRWCRAFCSSRNPTSPLFWTRQNPKKGENVVRSSHSCNHHFCLHENCRGAEKGQEAKYPRAVAPAELCDGPFFVHQRHLPMAAVQNQDPNMPTPCPAFLPPLLGLSWKRDLERRWLRKHKHTQAASWCPDSRERTLLQIRKGPSCLLGLWPLGRWEDRGASPLSGSLVSAAILWPYKEVRLSCSSAFGRKLAVTLGLRKSGPCPGATGYTERIKAQPMLYRSLKSSRVATK